MMNLKKITVLILSCLLLATTAQADFGDYSWDDPYFGSKKTKLSQKEQLKLTELIYELDKKQRQKEKSEQDDGWSWKKKVTVGGVIGGGVAAIYKLFRGRHGNDHGYDAEKRRIEIREKRTKWMGRQSHPSAGFGIVPGAGSELGVVSDPEIISKIQRGTASLIKKVQNISSKAEEKPSRKPKQSEKNGPSVIRTQDVGFSAEEVDTMIQLQLRSLVSENENIVIMPAASDMGIFGKQLINEREIRQGERVVVAPLAHRNNWTGFMIAFNESNQIEGVVYIGVYTYGIDVIPQAREECLWNSYNIINRGVSGDNLGYVDSCMSSIVLIENIRYLLSEYQKEGLEQVCQLKGLLQFPKEAIEKIKQNKELYVLLANAMKAKTYIDDEMNEILRARVNQEQLGERFTSYVVALDAVGITEGDNKQEQIQNEILQTRLQSEMENTYERIVLIPINTGSHWVGLAIHFNRDNQAKLIQYIDSFPNPQISERLINVLQSVYGDEVEIEAISILQQTDFVSCGPLAIENLILAAQGNLETRGVGVKEAAEIRDRHKKL